ncbi:MAG: type II toxin-antitoxin system RelE/ParE family toxin [Actinomycetota bacterium]|nr:type II toxin-antitoxin system RelE/ParE family toxin [Actinomycetota bacterium]
MHRGATPGLLVSFELDVWQEAQDDIADAAAWYSDKSPALGSQFLDMVEQCLAHVETQPARFPVVHGDARRALLGRFPYGLFFFIDERFVRVVACMHARQDPGRWQDRLRGDR